HPGQLEKVEVDLRNDFLIQLPKAQFSFVLSNLIRNAFKHGGPTKVEINSENNKLIIRDDGKGIPEENQERIFQMGYTTGKKGESSGIGLWFSKIIVNSFNGEISCNSSQGLNSYTEFTIKFPELDPSKITDEDRKRINTQKTNRIKSMAKQELAQEMLKEGKTIEEIESKLGIKPSKTEKYKIK
ncbi:MAG: HAMP domain-containing histidine kinase, partial [Bacteroidetes bacterium]|nr:HAMP domain-containing histidine kinase [Bacteroidota bacterium]